MFKSYKYSQTRHWRNWKTLRHRL